MCLVLLLFNSRKPPVFKSNFYSTNYNFAFPWDRTLRTTNNITNIDVFSNNFSGVFLINFFSFSLHIIRY